MRPAKKLERKAFRRKVGRRMLSRRDRLMLEAAPELLGALEDALPLIEDVCKHLARQAAGADELLPIDPDDAIAVDRAVKIAVGIGIAAREATP